MPDTTEIKKLNNDEIAQAMKDISPEWKFNAEELSISREFKFKNWFKTIAFVNVLAWHAQEKRHHPDLEVNYGRVLVKFTTHDVDGLSPLDFECAKLVDQI